MNYAPKQNWSRIETRQCMDFLNRLYTRVETFGIINMDENTEKCLEMVAKIYEKREEQLKELERSAK